MGADDMKAIVERLQADLIGQRALGLGDRAVRDDDIRALLIAYQEQRRALEDLIDHAEQCAARLDYHDAGIMGDEPVQAARAALKGKSHD
jgi:hypothetical protein